MGIAKLLAPIFLLITNIAFGQTVTPSFDAASHTTLPSGSALRDIFSVGASYKKNSGDLIFRDTTYARNTKMTSQQKGYELNAKMNVRVAAAELNILKTEEIKQGDSSDGENDKTEFSKIKLNLATPSVLGFYWGITAFKEKEKVQLFNQTIDTKGAGLGINFEIMQTIYLGAGLNYISNKDTHRVNNQWLERILGAAIITPIYRAEISWTHSPRSKKQKAGDVGVAKTVNHHPKTDRFNITTEIIWNSIFGSVGITRQSEEAPSANKLDMKTSILSLGAGYFLINKNFLISLYYIKRVRESEDKVEKEEYKDLSLNLSFKF